MTRLSYVGTELEIFSRAVNWKRYWADRIHPYVHGAVLEVGAGIGVNTPFLKNAKCSNWLCLEPDAALARELRTRCEALGCDVRVGTLEDVPESLRFDTILYIDVLEHIADDRAELQRATGLLPPGGHLVVISPAHQWLFTPFDAAIGHHRRYNRTRLRALTPPECQLATCFMLDCAGFFASLANKILLSAALPSKRQIAVWNELLVPISRILDRSIGYSFGKTIVAVWRPLSSWGK